MPKIPENEWKKSLDSGSEEHSPTVLEIESEQRMKETVSYELSDIEYELMHPTEDPYTGEKNKFKATDPGSFWDRLTYLIIDYIDKIKDPELRQDLENKVLRTEQRVYKQFVPFIESRINIFGWQNSPLEEHVSHHKLSTEEISSYFEQAHLVLKHFKISEEEQIDFLNELNRLQEKLNRYQSEPTIFTFEKVEEELQKEMFVSEFGYYYGQPLKTQVALDDEETQKKNLLKFDSLLAKARLLNKMANGMLNESIRTQCETRAKSLFEYAEYLKEKNEAPRELLKTEAELKDLIQRIKNGEQIEEEKLEQIRLRLSKMKDNKLDAGYRKVINRLEKLFEKTKTIFLGGAEDEDDARFSIESTGVDWAWYLLGVERNASKEDVKLAYHKLALKYHPDVSRKENATEKMKRINEAFELVRRVKGYK